MCSLFLLQQTAIDFTERVGLSGGVGNFPVSIDRMTYDLNMPSTGKLTFGSISPHKIPQQCLNRLWKGNITQQNKDILNNLWSQSP